MQGIASSSAQGSLANFSIEKIAPVVSSPRLIASEASAGPAPFAHRGTTWEALLCFDVVRNSYGWASMRRSPRVNRMWYKHVLFNLMYMVLRHSMHLNPRGQKVWTKTSFIIKVQDPTSSQTFEKIRGPMRIWWFPHWAKIIRVSTVLRFHQHPLAHMLWFVWTPLPLSSASVPLDSSRAIASWFCFESRKWHLLAISLNVSNVGAVLNSLRASGIKWSLHTGTCWMQFVDLTGWLVAVMLHQTISTSASSPQKGQPTNLKRLQAPKHVVRNIISRPSTYIKTAGWIIFVHQPEIKHVHAMLGYLYTSKTSYEHHPLTLRPRSPAPSNARSFAKHGKALVAQNHVNPGAPWASAEALGNQSTEQWHEDSSYKYATKFNSKTKKQTETIYCM